VHVQTRNVSRLDLLVSGRPQRSFDVEGDLTSADLQEILGEAAPERLVRELQGFEEDRLVARYRSELPRG